jgi:hypothetical protein
MYGVDVRRFTHAKPSLGRLGVDLTRLGAAQVRSLLKTESAHRMLSILLATWFVTISGMVLWRLGGRDAGLDATNYIGATRAWLATGDPWVGTFAGFKFGAPPPTLLVVMPFALLPDPFAWLAMMAVGPVLALVGIRLLGLPWWWCSFPPLLIAVYAGNPASWLPALMFVAPLAVVAKVYAALPLILLGRIRDLVVAAGILVVTAPLLPWDKFMAHLPDITSNAVQQTGGGMAGPLLPTVILLAVLFLRDRHRAAWLSIGALWPNSQWDYSSIAMPAGAVACAILAVPIQGTPLVAVAAAAVIALVVAPSRQISRDGLVTEGRAIRSSAA